MRREGGEGEGGDGSDEYNSTKPSFINCNRPFEIFEILRPGRTKDITEK